jgi:hypothetical protein
MNKRDDNKRIAEEAIRRIRDQHDKDEAKRYVEEQRKKEDDKKKDSDDSGGGYSDTNQ